MKVRLLFLFLLIAALSAACDEANLVLDTGTPTPVVAVVDPSETVPLEELPPGGEYAEVTKIIDGDTIWVQLGDESFKVRYIGLNAPEVGENEQPFGREATEFNRQLVEDQTVYLVKDVSETDKYDRLLRYVFVGDVFVNAELVRAGLAKAAKYPPDTHYADLLFDIQDDARATGLGIWGQELSP